jgi:hypothetical protein
MCPVLSLANRAFLALLGTLLAFTSLPTQAEELGFDLAGIELAPDNTHSVGPIDISFVLDTTRSTAMFDFGSSPFLQDLRGVASLSNLNVVLNGQLVQSLSSAGGLYGGGNPSRVGPGGCFCDMGLSPNLSWSFDAEPAISRAAFQASSDPLATMFLGFRWANPGNGRFNDLNLEFGHVTITDLGPSPASVPEPGTLGLFALGLVGVVLCGRKRISVRALALSA